MLRTTCLGATSLLVRTCTSLTSPSGVATTRADNTPVSPVIRFSSRFIPHGSACPVPSGKGSWAVTWFAPPPHPDLLHRGAHFLTHPQRPLFPRPHQYHNELVSAIAARHVGGPDVGGALARRLAQHHVPGLVPEPVVHLLEVVEVQKEYGKVLPGPVTPGNLVREPVAQHPERRQSRERIHRRLLLRQRRLTLEIAGARLERRPPLRRRDREFVTRRIPARARIPRPAVGRQPNLVEDLFHRLDARPGAVHLDVERRTDLDLDACGEHRRGRARRLRGADDLAPAEQLLLGAEQRMVETALARQDVHEAEVDAVDRNGARDPLQRAEPANLAEAPARLPLFL